MLFHFIVVILWLHTKHDNKLIAMQATLSYACGISDIPLKVPECACMGRILALG